MENDWNVPQKFTSCTPVIRVNIALCFIQKSCLFIDPFFVWCLVCRLTARNLKLRWWKISWFSDSGVKVDYAKQWSSSCCYGCLCEDEYWLFLLVPELWSANRIIDRGSLSSDNPFKTPSVVKCFFLWKLEWFSPHPHQIFRYSGSCNMVIAMKGVSFHLGVS